MLTTTADAPRSVLLIEDSMIIALDTEECLRALGIEDVVIQSSVELALTALAATRFDLAVLDFNLGEETSERVIDALRAMAIPFWLATGYTEMSERVDAFGASGFLVKPYGREELAGMLVQFAALRAAG